MYIRDFKALKASQVAQKVAYQKKVEDKKIGDVTRATMEGTTSTCTIITIGMESFTICAP